MEFLWPTIVGAFVGWLTALAMRGEQGTGPGSFLLGAIGGLLGEALFHLARGDQVLQIHFRLLPAALGSLVVITGSRLVGRKI